MFFLICSLRYIFVGDCYIIACVFLNLVLPLRRRAVADAASDYLQIVVFFPSGQISELQRPVSWVDYIGFYREIITFKSSLFMVELFRLVNYCN